MRILHLSDMHLFGDESAHYGVVDTAAALRRVISDAETIDDVDAVVCSGDLSDDGTPESYRKLREIVEPWASRHDARVLYAMGNHDDAAGFEEVLGDRIGSETVAGMRLVRLDSQVPGRGYGEIDETQLAWLRAELAASSEPAVVILHHPPTPALSPLLAALELQHASTLLEVCAEAGVRAILAGHYHHSLMTSEHGIPVMVAPGIANTTDAYAQAGHERARVGAGYAVVNLDAGSAATAPRVTVHRASSPADGQLLFDLGPDEVAAIAAMAGVPVTN